MRLGWVIVVINDNGKYDNNQLKKKSRLVTLTRLHLFHHTHSLGTPLLSPRPSSTRHTSATTPAIVRIWILIVLWKRARAGDIYLCGGCCCCEIDSAGAFSRLRLEGFVLRSEEWKHFFFQKVIYLLDFFFLKFEFSISFPLVPRRLNDPVKYLDYVTKCMRKLNVELITIASKHKTKGREIQNL